MRTCGFAGQNEEGGKRENIWEKGGRTMRLRRAAVCREANFCRSYCVLESLWGNQKKPQSRGTERITPYATYNEFYPQRGHNPRSSLENHLICSVYTRKIDFR